MTNGDTNLDALDSQASPEGMPELEVEYDAHLIGKVDIAKLFRKNSDLNFTRWIDQYESSLVQDEMRAVLGVHGCAEADVNKLIDQLTSTNQNEHDKAVTGLKELVDKVLVYGKDYERATEESEEFKLDMITDSISNFARREIVEGFNTRPVATLAKVGIAALLVHQVWKGITNPETKKWIWRAGLGAAGLYVLNGMWPNFNDEQRTLFDYLGGKKRVKSPSFRWFFNEAGIESSEKISTLFAVADTKIDKLVDLYRQGKGIEEIDISQLVDYSDPDSARKLEKLDTARSRRALFMSIAELVQLADIEPKTPGELLKKYKGETLTSVVLDVYRHRNGGSLEQTEQEANDRAIENLSESEEETRLRKLFNDEWVKDDIEQMKGDNQVDLVVRDNRIWIDGYPFVWELVEDEEAGEKKSIGSLQEIILKDVRGGGALAGLPHIIVGREYTTEKFQASLKEVKDHVHSQVVNTYNTRYKNHYPQFKDYAPVYNEDRNKWEIRHANGDNYYLAGEADLGLDEQYLPLTLEVNKRGSLRLYIEGYSERLSPENVNDVLKKAALKQSIAEKGPLCFQRNSTLIDKVQVDPETDPGKPKYGLVYIKTYQGTVMHLRYDKHDDEYKVEKVAWGANDTDILDAYSDDFENRTGALIDDIENYVVELDVENGFPQGYVNEFERLLEKQSGYLEIIYRQSLLQLDGSKSGDLNAEILRLEEKMIADLTSSSEKIKGNYDAALQWMIDHGTNRVGGGPKEPGNKDEFKLRFLDELLGAGITDTTYELDLKIMMDKFTQEELRYSIFPGGKSSQRFLKNYYSVKDEIFTFYFDKTGGFATNVTTIGPKESAYMDSVESTMELELREAFADDNWAQRLPNILVALGALDTGPLSRVGAQEIEFEHDVFDPEATYQTPTPSPPGPRPQPPYRPRQGGGGGSIERPEDQPEYGGGEYPSFTMEKIDYPLAQSQVWSEYQEHIDTNVREYVGQQVDALIWNLGGISLDTQSIPRGWLGIDFLKADVDVPGRSSEFLQELLRDNKSEIVDDILKGLSEPDSSGYTPEQKIWEILQPYDLDYNNVIDPINGSDDYLDSAVFEEMDEYFKSKLDFSGLDNINKQIERGVRSSGGQLNEDKYFRLAAEIVNSPEGMPGEDDPLGQTIRDKWADLQTSSAELSRLKDSGDKSAYDAELQKFATLSSEFNTLANDPEFPELQSDYRKYLQGVILAMLADPDSHPNFGSASDNLLAYEASEITRVTDPGVEEPDWYAEALDTAFRERREEMNSLMNVVIEGGLDNNNVPHLGLRRNLRDTYRLYVQNDIAREINDIWDTQEAKDRSFTHKLFLINEQLDELQDYLDNRNKFWEGLSNCKVKKEKDRNIIGLYEQGTYEYISSLNFPHDKKVAIHKSILGYVLGQLQQGQPITKEELKTHLVTAFGQADADKINVGGLYLEINKKKPKGSGGGGSVTDEMDILSPTIEFSVWKKEVDKSKHIDKSRK